MGKQIRTELYKAFHSNATIVSLAAYLLFLLLFWKSGSIMMMVAGNLAVPSESVGFFKGVIESLNVPMGTCVLRSAQSFMIFSWLIGLNYCISVFSSESKNHTLSLFICHGGKVGTLYRAKIFVTDGIISVFQLAFTLLCLIISSRQLNYELAVADILKTVIIALLNIIILLAFLQLSIFMLTLIQSRVVAELILCFIPTIGAFLYGLNFEGFQSLPIVMQFIIKMLPTYYWANICSLRFTNGIIWETLVYTIVLLCITMLGTVIILKRREVK